MDRKLPSRFTVPSGGTAALAGLFFFALTTAPMSVRAQATQSGHRDAGPEQHEEDRHEEDHLDEGEMMDRAGRIAVQPVRDVGIARDHIPPVLQEAAADPYAVPEHESCPWLNYELARLDQALGPDFDADAGRDANRAQRIALAGGEMVVNSLIPFRGLVREISGAAPAERRRLAATNAGLARRGYIRGLAQAKGCPMGVRTAAR